MTPWEFVSTHHDKQIREAGRIMQCGQASVLANFVYDFAQLESITKKVAFVAAKHVWIKGWPNAKETPHMGLKKASKAARMCHKEDWMTVLFEFDELLCERGIIPRIVTNFQLKTRADLILLIRFYEACHYMGYDFDEAN